MALETLIGASPKVEKVGDGFTNTSGPVFSRRGYLLFSDVAANRILQWRAGTVKPLREKTNGANGLTFDHQGRLLTCERGRVTRTEKDGSIQILADAFEGSRLTDPTDLVYAIDGSVYFSVSKQAVYQVTRQGKLRLATRECEGPSGVALAPNQQRLFVSDTDRRNVRVFDIQGDGSLSKGRIFCELSGNAGGAPAGLKTDEAGHVWVAGPGGIWIFDNAGTHLGTAPIPESPSNCAWGAGFRDLYVTARTSVYRLQTKVNGTRTY
jgi:gluconolactonase